MAGGGPAPPVQSSGMPGLTARPANPTSASTPAPTPGAVSACFAACGAFGFAAASDGLLGRTALNLAGYPADRDDASRPYFHGRFARSVDAHFIQYEIDTWGGQSGAPVWIRRGRSRR